MAKITKPVPLHKLRHTAATIALTETRDLHSVQMMLGHQHVALTANLYGHAIAEGLRPTLDALGTSVRPPEPEQPKPDEPQAGDGRNGTDGRPDEAARDDQVDRNILPRSARLRRCAPILPDSESHLALQGCASVLAERMPPSGPALRLNRTDAMYNKNKSQFR